MQTPIGKVLYASTATPFLCEPVQSKWTWAWAFHKNDFVLNFFDATRAASISCQPEHSNAHWHFVKNISREKLQGKCRTQWVHLNWTHSVRTRQFVHTVPEKCWRFIWLKHSCRGQVVKALKNQILSRIAPASLFSSLLLPPYLPGSSRNDFCPRAVHAVVASWFCFPDFVSLR